MSGTAGPELDLREQIARIDRAMIETEKLAAESRKLSAEALKLSAEQLKLSAEQLKLAAEAQKIGWDIRFAPYLAIAAVIAALLGVATFIAHLMGH
jgi:prepilin signal peptidase PulO-like enzyme (type II secretory pathway)